MNSIKEKSKTTAGEAHHPLQETNHSFAASSVRCGGCEEHTGRRRDEPKWEGTHNDHSCTQSRRVTTLDPWVGGKILNHPRKPVSWQPERPHGGAAPQRPTPRQ